jgi:hypothetical protein|tara:strand:- start:1850 stop:2722 length:873 start_codon:yes stop_codon:yes gene_type:complete
MFERIKNFSTLLGFSALFIAGCAAFYSVFGLSKLFAGSAVAVIFMASSLELGKLVAASFLYRFWDDINLAIKTYLIIGVITLVLITSAGIFGFLSNAYQGATVQFEKQSNELLALEDRLEQLEDDRTFLKDEFEQSVNDLPENYITAKRKLREQFNPQIQKLNEQILNVKSRKSDLEISLIETGVDVGPAIYLARVFDTDIDSVVKFFIFILIFVFDPMAVCLIIAYNKSLEQNKTGVEKIFDKYKSKVKVVKSKKKIVPNKKKEIVIKEVDENNEKNLSSPKGGIKPSS